jgi:hypothetical protein
MDGEVRSIRLCKNPVQATVTTLGGEIRVVHTQGDVERLFRDREPVCLALLWLFAAGFARSGSE